jgi:formiminoglutamase
MGKFVVASREYLDTMISNREGETKLGQRVLTIETEAWEQELAQCPARFVVLGIPEDIGVRANLGVGGTHTFWPAALKALLNVQSTSSLDGEEVLVFGHFDFSDKIRQSERMEIAGMRELVSYVDEAVYPIVTKIVAAGKVPVVVGGGHNNSLPLLKGASMVNDKPVNCINLDAHSDFRPMEGRHSGNGFRYAHRGGFLDKYSVIGLHENYNSREIIDELVDDPDLHFSYYEDIFIRHKLTFEQAVKNAIGKTSGRPVGLELDLDCIERVLSSAKTPCGITSLQARQYVTMCAEAIHPVYLHLAEGAVELRDGRKDASTAKLAAYLITDFIKAYKQKKGFFS